MVLEPVRFGLEVALLERMGLGHVGVPVVEASARRGTEGRTPAPRVFGQPGEPDEETLEWMKMRAATKATWRIEQLYQTFGDVAVISISGVIDKHLSDADLDCYGGCDLADVDKALSIAANDPKIERVVVYANTPGGSVVGVPETAARIAALREKKEVRGFVDGMAASAGYYLLSQADAIDCAPSAQLGSVGVYCTLLDQTRALELKGYKVELIKAGKFKAMGSPFKALTDDERGMIQERVTSLHTKFRAAVNSQRPQVSLDDMEGQCFDGEQSLARGLCDSLTGANLDEYVAALL